MGYPEDVKRHVYADEREHPDRQAANYPGEPPPFGRGLHVPVLIYNQQKPSHKSGCKVYEIKVVEEIERLVEGTPGNLPRTGNLHERNVGEKQQHTRTKNADNPGTSLSKELWLCARERQREVEKESG